MPCTMILPAQLTDKLVQFTRPLGRYSLPDWAFLPLSALAGAGLIALAMSYRPEYQAPTYTQSQFIMREAALGELIPGPGTRVELVTVGQGDTVARLSAMASFESVGLLSAGVGAALSEVWEERVVGRMLRIEVEAMPAPASSVQQIRLGYFTTGFGDSARQLVTLQDDWDTVGICFQVSADARPNANESVGIWPGDAGTGEAVLVREIQITIEPEQTSQAQCESQIGAER